MWHDAGAESRRNEDAPLFALMRTLASLAPGDYLVELALGEGGARHVIVVAFRIVPQVKGGHAPPLRSLRYGWLTVTV